uniref:Interleukin 34 n=1 Tax=Buteo japonicus TaxID=224669 RepID=A0A8C0BHR6_9AVES
CAQWCPELLLLVHLRGLTTSKGVSLSPCCQPLRSSLPFQKHYFPINYTVQVQYEEVLRPSNITRLRNGTVSEAALRYLWFHVSSQAVLRIREVLPERHPSWKYTQELCQLFDALGKEYSKYRQTDVEVVVADLVKLVHSGGAESRRKAVRPKALLDNCLKVMRMLYGVPCEWGPATPRTTVWRATSVSPGCFPGKKTSGFVCCAWQ